MGFSLQCRLKIRLNISTGTSLNQGTISASERFIYFQDQSVYSAAGKYVSLSWNI
jgi:hypothetical protein